MKTELLDHPMTETGLVPGRALIVGINKYPAQPLRSAVKDARDLAALLRDRHGFQDVTLLEDEAATPARLLQELTALGQRSTAEDRVLVYFAGHGLLSQGKETPLPEGSLLLYGADVSGALPMKTFTAHLDASLRCRHLLLILDCCHAGAAAFTGRARPWQPRWHYREQYEFYLKHKAWQLLTSTAASETALDQDPCARRGGDESTNSPFAAALLDGLKGKADVPCEDSRGDGLITPSELREYIESRMLVMYEQTRVMQHAGLHLLDRSSLGQFLFWTPEQRLALKSIKELRPDQRPYRGLLSYTQADEEVFFGRTKFTQELKDAFAGLGAGQRLALVSASGSGKSSVVRAGLLPRLKKEEWEAVVLQPGAEPGKALANAKRQLLVDAKVVLVIDQAEELHTQALKEEAERFLQGLEALEKKNNKLRVVLTLREDYAAHFKDGLLKGAKEMRLEPMTNEELREVVEGPARLYAVNQEPALVDGLMDDVAAQPGALPLLSFVLNELYEHCVMQQSADRLMRLDDYKRMGGLGRSMATRADQVRDEVAAAVLVKKTVQGTDASVEKDLVKAAADGALVRKAVPRWDALASTDQVKKAVDGALVRLMMRMTVQGTQTAGRPVRSWDLRYAMDREVDRLEEVLQRMLLKALTRDANVSGVIGSAVR